MKFGGSMQNDMPITMHVKIETGNRIPL